MIVLKDIKDSQMRGMITYADLDNVKCPFCEAKDMVVNTITCNQCHSTLTDGRHDKSK